MEPLLCLSRRKGCAAQTGKCVAEGDAYFALITVRTRPGHFRAGACVSSGRNGIAPLVTERMVTTKYRQEDEEMYSLEEVRRVDPEVADAIMESGE